MQQFFKGAVAAAALTFTAVSASAATVTVYTDRTAFESALSGGFAVETFDATPAGVTITGSDVNISAGRLNDQINDNANVSTTFDFTAATNGFGGDWDLAGPGGMGTGIALSLSLVGGGVMTVASELPSSLSNAFWGIVSDVAFTSVSMREGTQVNGVETYTMDNLTTGSVAPVPLPATLPLLLAALGGVAVMRRRQAKA